jgi:hypothetical protein
MLRNVVHIALYLIALYKLRNEMQTHCVHGSFLKSKYLIKICKIYVVKFSGLIAIVVAARGGHEPY